MKENILGYSVNAFSLEQCGDELINNLTHLSCTKSPAQWLACINPHSYAVAFKDPLFSSALKDADWLVADGAGIVLASWVLGGSIRQRVTGSDVFCGLLQRMNQVGGMSVFFLGATEETLSLIRSKMAVDFPRITVAGTYSPPFNPEYTHEELDEMIAAVNAAKPDVLWVGMTAPKQEKWIYQNRDRLNVRFAGAIGAVFDFYTGRVKRSHPFFRRLGLEWLPRLIQQPRRLWRRMFVSAPIFLWHLMRQRLFKLPFS